MAYSTKSVFNFKLNNKVLPMSGRLLGIAFFRVGRYSRSDGNSGLENGYNSYDFPNHETHDMPKGAFQ